MVDAGGDAALLAAAMRLPGPAGHCHSVGISFDDATVLPLGAAYMAGAFFSTGRPDVLASIPASPRGAPGVVLSHHLEDLLGLAGQVGGAVTPAL